MSERYTNKDIDTQVSNLAKILKRNISVQDNYTYYHNFKLWVNSKPAFVSEDKQLFDLYGKTKKDIYDTVLFAADLIKWCLVEGILQIPNKDSLELSKEELEFVYNLIPFWVGGFSQKLNEKQLAIKEPLQDKLSEFLDLD